MNPSAARRRLGVNHGADADATKTASDKKRTTKSSGWPGLTLRKRRCALVITTAQVAINALFVRLKIASDRSAQLASQTTNTHRRIAL